MSNDILSAEKAHLSGLLEAIQRCVYFLHASDQKLTWPLSAEYLTARKKDVSLFESLAAINERFAKLQDTARSCNASRRIIIRRTQRHISKSDVVL